MLKQILQNRIKELLRELEDLTDEMAKESSKGKTSVIDIVRGMDTSSHTIRLVSIHLQLTVISNMLDSK